MTHPNHPSVLHHPPGHRPTDSSFTECPDPDCTLTHDQHPVRLPCRWAWKEAHGKAHGGQPFPIRRCPGCYHIRRAGRPIAEQEAQ